MILKINYFIIGLFLFITNILSQPYKYYPQLIENSSQNAICRINQANGERELFINNVGYITSLFQFDNSYGTILFLDQRGFLNAIKTDNPNKIIEMAEGYGIVLDIKEATMINKFIVEYSSEDPSIYEKTILYNMETLEPIDTIRFFSSNWEDYKIPTFLSKDNKTLYAHDMDTAGIYFSAYDLLNNRLIYEHKRVTSLGQSILRSNDYYLIEEGKCGKALFINRDDKSKKWFFFVVNPDSGLYFKPIFINAENPKGLLSANGDYVIIEETKFISDNTNSNIGYDYFLGKVHVYCSRTGNKITDITIPPSDGWGILLKDSSPNKIYYFDPTKNGEVTIDITTLSIKNNLSGLVKLRITQPDSLTNFSYSITNSDTSSQSIKNIYVENKGSVTSVNLPSGWVNIEGVNKYNLIGINSESDGILSGTEISGFEITTNGLPTIGKVYLQSGRSEIDSSDIYGNSYVVETLVPTKKPLEFNAVKFVDTLIYYNNKSLINNWLSAEWVKKIIENSLNNAKMFTGQKLYTSAIPVVQQLITILDSYKTSGFIKDEAYFLLKINSRYLIEKLNSLAVKLPKEALAQLDLIIEANLSNKTNSLYSADWIFNTLESILNNAKITLNQNNKAGCKSIIEQFIATIDSYKTSGFITAEGLNNMKPKCLTLIEMLK